MNGAWIGYITLPDVDRPLRVYHPVVGLDQLSTRHVLERFAQKAPFTAIDLRYFSDPDSPEATAYASQHGYTV